MRILIDTHYTVRMRTGVRVAAPRCRVEDALGFETGVAIEPSEGVLFGKLGTALAGTRTRL